MARRNSGDAILEQQPSGRLARRHKPKGLQAPSSLTAGSQSKPWRDASPRPRCRGCGARRSRAGDRCCKGGAALASPNPQPPRRGPGAAGSRLACSRHEARAGSAMVGTPSLRTGFGQRCRGGCSSWLRGPDERARPRPRWLGAEHGLGAQRRAHAPEQGGARRGDSARAGGMASPVQPARKARLWGRVGARQAGSAWRRGKRGGWGRVGLVLAVRGLPRVRCRDRRLRCQAKRGGHGGVGGGANARSG
mmetsp:Transcript_3495/g.14448  ORF Transcript_3495/g.14448 Transcript_3495/m.14448 type:complete len:249 (-) Transcript_3495:2954-3700(-)